MAAGDYLGQYAEGWTKGDAQIITGSLADNYQLDDPNAGMINKQGLAEYLSGMWQVVEGIRGKTSDPVQLIHPSVKPLPGEVVVGKHRVNALFGTDLDMVLRSNNIETLVILGYATSGVVLSTVRYAADLDYRLLVVEDCCSDQDPEVHDFLTQRIFPRQTDVVGSEDVISALSTR